MRLFRQSTLSNQFYVALALKLEQRLFSPLENIIEPHHHADCLFIIERGMVLSRGRVMRCGDCFGDEAVWSGRCAAAAALKPFQGCSCAASE